jgi:hypothetical protein
MRCKDADRLERVVQLYFVRGWSVRNICLRYQMTKPMVQKLISEWRIRAVSAGYIQEIDSENLQALARAYEQRTREAPDGAPSHDATGREEFTEEFTIGSPAPVWTPAAIPAQDAPRMAAGGGI